MVQILKDFYTKSGDRKVHFELTGSNGEIRKVIAQGTHAFMAFLVINNYLINEELIKFHDECLNNDELKELKDAYGDDIFEYAIGEAPKRDYNGLFTRGLPSTEINEKLMKYPFYAAVASSMSKARVRDIKRGKLFQSIFKCNTVDHFKPIDGAKTLCSEEYAAEYSAETFRVCMDEYADPSGYVALTDNLRVIINNKTSNEVKKLGWEFDYIEYNGVEIDWALYDALAEIFTDEYRTITQIKDAVKEMLLEGTTLPEDIYKNSEVEKVFNRNTVHVFEDAVDFSEDKMMSEIETGDAFTNTIPTDEELAFERDKYFMNKIRQYIINTDKLRDEYLDEDEIDECARGLYEWYLNIKARC